MLTYYGFGTLSSTYENGELDLAIDLEAAFTWYQELAKLGEHCAQRRLGLAYENGDFGRMIGL